VKPNVLSDFRAVFFSSSIIPLLVVSLCVPPICRGQADDPGPASPLSLEVPFDVSDPSLVPKAPIRNDVVRRGSPKLKEIALTFDGGPIFPDEIVPRLKDPFGGSGSVFKVLQETGIKGTFFMIGKQVKAHQDFVSNVFQEGHSIGNHTWDHAIKTKGLVNLNQAERIKEITMGNQAIKAALKPSTSDVPLFRLPYGAGSWPFSQEVLDLIPKHHKYNVLWSLDSMDWTGQGATKTVSKVLNCKQLDGAIILLHDSADGTANAVRRFVPELKKRGYTFVTVDELLAHTAKAENKAE